MKKFKKPLTINVMQDDNNQHSSPKNINYKNNKQKQLLMYNQHTITSSANNQDQQNLQHRQNGQNCQEFTEFYQQNPFQSVKTQQSANFQGDKKFQKYKKFNVIQFQEFSLEQDFNKTTNQTSIKSSNKPITNAEKVENKYYRKQFSIEIPDNEQKTQKQQVLPKLIYDTKSENINKKQRSNIVKQPPAPSNKAKISKSHNRHFIFPTNDQEKFAQFSQKAQNLNEKTSVKKISQFDHNLQINQLNLQWTQKLQEANKSFQKERQQFYKQKSNLQKDLMIKDGQIQMLQKLITNRYSPKQGSIGNSYSNQTLNDKPQMYRFGNNERAKSSKITISDEKLNSLQTILLQKDLQINSLLQKINDLNAIIEKKNNDIQETKINLMKNQKLNESLQNQIYLYQKKQQSQKLTKQFYKVRQTLNQVHQSTTKTPKGYSRHKWEDQISKEKQKSIQVQKPQYPLRGIDDLHKRLQSLKMNRIQLQSRGKIKSQIGYSQTSKNKTKGTFDFKGKFYERERDYINHTRMY